MLLRISLILAIVAALAAGTLSYFAMTDKIPALKAQRDDEHGKKVAALNDLSKTRIELTQTQNALTKSQHDLAAAKSEREKAETKAEAQTKRADELSDKLAKLTNERDAIQNLLAAYKDSHLTPAQVMQLSKDFKNAEIQIAAIKGENAVLNRKLTATKAELAKFIDPDSYIKLRADLKGKIVVVDPKWDFVVLNIGEEQGAIKDGELLVSREGKLVAKVILSSVQKDRSIANVVPGWKLGEMIEGDEVTPAHPAS